MELSTYIYSTARHIAVAISIIIIIAPSLPCDVARVRMSRDVDSALHWLRAVRREVRQSIASQKTRETRGAHDGETQHSAMRVLFLQGFPGLRVFYVIDTQ